MDAAEIIMSSRPSLKTRKHISIGIVVLLIILLYFVFSYPNNEENKTQYT